MSNLSELLPTGGGQNAVDFVASGTLSSGQTVILRSDGKVEAVAEESATASVGSTATFSSTYLSSIAGCYDTLNNKLVLSYRHEFNSNYGTVVVGTVSGTSISFGTPVIFESGLATSNGITFDSNAGKVLLAFRNSSAQGEAIVGTVSGTSISFGSSSIWESSYSVSPLVIDYDSNAQKSLIVARKDGGAGDSYIYGYVATISGTSVSFGTRGTISPSNNTAVTNLEMAYDSDQNQFVIIYQASLPSNSTNVIAAAISGTSVSGGTPVELLNNQTSGTIPYISYSPLAQKFLALYCDASDVLYGVPVTNANLTLTLGAAVSSTISPVVQLGGSYDVLAQTFTVVAATASSATQGKVIQAEVSASGVLSWGTQTSYTTGTARDNTAVYDPDTQKTLIAYHDNSAGKSAVYTAGYTRTNSANFIGITAEAISDTATGAVNVYGGINEAQTGLTIGSDYYVDSTGAISTSPPSIGKKLGKAISATTLNLLDYPSIAYATGQQAFTTAGTYSWVAPAGVTSVSVVAVGGGGAPGSGSGGGGGELRYKNNISVSGGSSYTVVVGSGGGSGGTFAGSSSFNGSDCVANGGGNALSGSSTQAGGSGGIGDGGGNGGTGMPAASSYGSGGGAGGYSGNGGNGGNNNNHTAGTGGAGGGGASYIGSDYRIGYGGGGVGILGEGSSAAKAGSTNVNGGSGGANGGGDGTNANGGLYGGGSGSATPTGTVIKDGQPYANGAVRIIWGSNRAFPSTNTGDL